MKMEFTITEKQGYSQVEFKLGTVKGRHEMPVQNFIYEEDVKDFAIPEIEKHVDIYIENLIETFAINHFPELSRREFRKHCLLTINLYLTGLTSITTSVIKICKENRVGLNLYHYDPTTQNYQEQIMF